MDWLRKLLEKHGVGEDLLKAIMDDSKDQNYIPKARFDEVNEQLKGYKTQTESLKQIAEEYEGLKPSLEAMKAASSENPLLKQQLEDLQKKLEASSTQLNDYQNKNQEWEKKYKDTQIDTAIKLGLVNAKVNPKYSDLLSTKFDKSKFEFNDDGSIKGLEEQLKSVQENYKELFGEVVPTNAGANPPGVGNPPIDESKMSDAEWFAAQQNK